MVCQKSVKMDLGNVFGGFQKNDHKNVQVKAEVQRVPFEIQPKTAKPTQKMSFLLIFPF